MMNIKTYIATSLAALTLGLSGCERYDENDKIIDKILESRNIPKDYTPNCSFGDISGRLSLSLEGDPSCSVTMPIESYNCNYPLNEKDIHNGPPHPLNQN